MRQSRAAGLLFFSMTCVAAIVAHAQAVAQSAPVSTESHDASVLSEIIVTAQKRSERLSDVPMSIAAVSGDQLQDRGVTQVDDLQKIVPGFTARPSDAGIPIYSIRGVGYFDKSLAASPTVSIYVDQVPLPFSAMAQGVVLDLERVEVLKGPQGTLFGENSTGGAINFIANKPTQTFKAGATVGAGNFGAVNASGFVSGPISDSLTARLALSTDQRGDWQRSETRDDTLGQRNFSAGRLLLDWTPTDALSFELNLNGWLNKSDTQASQFVAFAPSVATGYSDNFAALEAYKPVGNDPRIADWDPNTSFARNDHLYQVSLHADWALSPSITLTSITAYSNLHERVPLDIDGTAIAEFNDLQTGYIEAVTQELRMDGTSFGDKLKWMVGGNYEHDRTGDYEVGILSYSVTGVGPLRYRDIATSAYQKIDTAAAFVSTDYSLLSNLTASASARYTASDDSYRGCVADTGDGTAAQAFSLLASSPIGPGQCVTLDPVTLAPVPVIANSLNENNVSWRVGLSWKPNSLSLLYANVTQGYKAGAFSIVPAVFPSQADPVVQEKVQAYEAGFKSALLENTVRLNGAVFYYDYTNKQTQGTKPTLFGPLPGLVTIPASAITGAELEANWKPTGGLTLAVNGTYVRSRIESHLLIPSPLGEPTDVHGEAFANTPKFQASADVQYDFPVAKDLSGFVGGSVSYRTSSYTAIATSNPDFRLPSYALLDLRAGVQTDDAKWRLELWGRNVTDRFYVPSVIRYADTISRYAGMPATFGAAVSYRY
jgi:iron complex outermembrane recepter protein